MLTITLIALILAIPLSSTSAARTSSPSFGGGGYGQQVTISATLYTRIVAIALLFAAVLSYNAFPSINPTGSFYSSIEEAVTYLEGENGEIYGPIDAGLGLYSGLIHATTVTQTIEVFLLISGALILLPWSANINRSISLASAGSPTIPEYPMIILFTTIGATFLLASADLVSIYLAIELQSFGVYILAALYRDSESATAAGLKYFLLGALSSALILLGSALVYGYTGLTNLDSIYELMSVPSHLMQSGTIDNDSYSQIIILGFLLISVGLLFKVASAPFHYWAPDVYDGAPTIVTTWLTVMPKISIFIFLLELYSGITTTQIMVTFSEISFINITTYLLLICAFISLVIGTIVGLGQYRIKRLLAYSTISHVGFLLLALSISSASIFAGEESAEAFLFYIVQYTLTNINAFFVLLAFGYVLRTPSFSSSSISSSPSFGGEGGGKIDGKNSDNSDISFTSELVGQFRHHPILGLSMAICLFSMAGVPPLVGFFAKYTILYSAIHNGYVFLSIIAIIASVVSAVYYLRIIRVIHFDSLYPSTLSYSSSLSSSSFGGGEGEQALKGQDDTIALTSVHSYVIASITLFILLFAFFPTLILNSTSIMALSMYVT